MSSLKSFKAYDIRGVWGKDLYAELVYKIGFFLPRVLNAQTILVGRDVRLSSDEMFFALTEGITEAGANVIDAGLATTPMIYWGTGKFDFDASVMITASHNHKSYNGLKFSGKGVKPIGYDNGLNLIESLIAGEEPLESGNKGMIGTTNWLATFLDYMTVGTVSSGIMSISSTINFPVVG